MINEKKDLHLCVVMSDSYFPIYQKIFNKTLPREFDSVNILHVRDCDSVPGAVGEENFKIINYKKLQFIAKQLIAHEGDNLLVLDLDVVCFKNFKDEINLLLRGSDMVFQHNQHYENMPYCVATWALQCSRKNINFFDREILPRSKALLLTKDFWDDIVRTKTHVPSKWLHHLNGKQQYLDGDACVVNAAILESDSGKKLNISLLSGAYAQGDGTLPDNPEECILYQAASTGTGASAKATALINVYEHIKGKQQ